VASARGVGAGRAALAGRKTHAWPIRSGLAGTHAWPIRSGLARKSERMNPGFVLTLH
jgi:hypothetical protein